MTQAAEFPTNQEENPAESPASVPPGGALNLDDALAAALAAVEAVEARQAGQEAEARQAGEVAEAAPAESVGDAVDFAPVPDSPRPESSVLSSAPRPTPIRGMPTVGSADARAQLADQVRDLTLKLADARRAQERSRQEMEQVQADLSVLRKRYQKIGAETDDLRKRLQKAEMDLPDHGARNVLGALLGPLDHLHDVFEHLSLREPLSPEGREALAMLRAQWQRAMSALQVTPFDAVGQPYDPHLHECIAQAQSEQQPGQVIRQVGRGYLLAGRMLRSARVVVSTGPNPPPPEEPHLDVETGLDPENPVDVGGQG